MEALRELHDEFVERYVSKEIHWLDNVAIEDVYYYVGSTRVTTERAVEDLEKLLADIYYSVYPYDSVLLGPALGDNDLPIPSRSHIGIYVTTEGRESNFHQSWLQSNGYRSTQEFEQI